MIAKIKNFFKKQTENDIDPRSFRRAGFLKAAKKQGEKAKKYANVNLTQLMYHPAVTEEDFETLDKFIQQIELKSRNYIKGI